MTTFNYLLNASLGTGDSRGTGVTTYYNSHGELFASAAVAAVQDMVRASYTLSNLFVRVSSNGITANTSYTVQVNGVDKSLTVTFGSGVTGNIQDTTHTVTLTSGDLINTKIVTGGAGTAIVTNVIGGMLHATVAAAIFATCQAQAFGPNATVFSGIIGRTYWATTEAFFQYKFRSAGVVSNLRVFASANLNAAATTTTPRKNGSSVGINETVTVPATTTGAFEDTTNTDSFVSTDLIDIQTAAGNGAGNITYTVIQLKFTGNQTIGVEKHDGNPSHTTSYAGLQDEVNIATLQANIQCLPPFGFTAQNLFAYCYNNTIVNTSSCAFELDLNGVANVVISWIGGATGYFENTTDTLVVHTTDKINFDTQAIGNGVGSMNITQGGVIVVPIDPPTDTTNPATMVKPTQATLNGTLNTDGGLVCTCGFRWGLTQAYGNTTPTTSQNAGDKFKQTITGLLPGHIYHFQAFATNVGGTVFGADARILPKALGNVILDQIIYGHADRMGR